MSGGGEGEGKRFRTELVNGIEDEGPDEENNKEAARLDNSSNTENVQTMIPTVHTTPVSHHHWEYYVSNWMLGGYKIHFLLTLLVSIKLVSLSPICQSSTL